MAHFGILGFYLPPRIVPVPSAVSNVRRLRVGRFPQESEPLAEDALQGRREGPQTGRPGERSQVQVRPPGGTLSLNPDPGAWT